MTNIAESLAEQTPEGRDRVIDLVRAFSIVVVVLGHWSMAALQRSADGTLRLANVLETSPALHPLTWVFQVMPLFFVAAGFTTALAFGRPRRDWRSFVAGRSERVLSPTLLFVGVWLPLAWLLPHLGVPPALVAIAAQSTAMVLWFLAVYVLLTLVAPLQYAVHSRWPWLLLVLLPVVAFCLDRVQGTPLAAVGFLNYLVVFGFCAELGSWYARGSWSRLPRRVWLAVGAGAALALVLFTVIGPYPVSMIGLPGQDISNMMPPSVCVIAVGLLQFSIVMLVRPELARWLHRPVPWLATVVVNRSAMTIFLWHLTAFVAVAWVLLMVGFPLPDPATEPMTFWLLKLVWIALCALVLAALVRVASPVEWRPGRAAQAPGRYAVIGGVAAVLGLTMVAAAGFTNVWEPGGISLGGLTSACGPGVVLLLLGWVLCRWPATSAAQAPHPDPLIASYGARDERHNSQ